MAVLVLTSAMTFASAALAQQKPFTQEQVTNMVKDGFGDGAGAKLIEQRGIDFPATEDFVQSLKAAGASEAFLRALRAVKSPLPAGTRKPLNRVEVCALLAGEATSHRVALLVEERGLNFQPTDDYLQEARLAGGGDELASALKKARVTKPKHVDPALEARETEVCRYAARGAEFMREKRYSDAETAFRAAVRLAPQESNLHLSLSWAMGANDHLDGAIDECREALRLNPNNDDAHYFLGRALGHEGDFDGEVAEYRAALGANPANALAHLYLGIALGHQADWEGVVVQYREALRLDSNDEYAHLDLGPTIPRKDDTSGVIALCRRALGLNPNQENTRLNLGLALGMDGDWDGAIAEERKVLVTNPNSAPAHYILGLAFDAKGNSQAAVQEYRTACGLDPQNRDYRLAYERLREPQNQ
jgi:tetratricopeptide (TPR) repeat protein